MGAVPCCSWTCGAEGCLRDQKAQPLHVDDAAEEPMATEHSCALWRSCLSGCGGDAALRVGGSRPSAGDRHPAGAQDFLAESGREAVLGCSSIGTVVKTRHRRSSELHALRQISKKWLQGGAWKEEVETLRRLDHPHICKLHDTWEDSMSLYMIMELCKGGNLTDLSANVERLNESSIAVLMEQMVSAVGHLHAHSVAHSDLRPENWLFSEPVAPTSSALDMTLKMIDFGLASKHTTKGRRCSHPEVHLGGRGGGAVPSHGSRGPPRDVVPADGPEATMHHLFCQAPEQLLQSVVQPPPMPESPSSRAGEAVDPQAADADAPRSAAGEKAASPEAVAEAARFAAGEKADCWALGVIAYFMLSGQSPFDVPSAAAPEKDFAFQHARFVFMPTSIWRPVSSQAKHFIALCLQQDPSLRPPARALAKLPWMRMAKAASGAEEAAASPCGSEDESCTSDGRPSWTRMTVLGPPLPTAPAIRHSLEQMKQLQLIERAATIAAAFRIPESGLPTLQKALEARDPAGAGALALQDLLHVLSQSGIAVDDLLALATPLDGSCPIGYADFLDGVKDFQRNTQDNAIWEVFSRFDADREGRVDKRRLAKALGEQEYHQSIAAKFPQLPLDRVVRELGCDGGGSLGFEELRQVLAEANAPNVDPRLAK